MRHELGAIVGGPQRPALAVRELSLDHIGVDVELFNQDGPRHRTQAMGRHLFVRVAHAAQRGAQRVLAHRAFARQQAGEHITAMPVSG